MNKKLVLTFASFAVVGVLVGAAFPAAAWSVRQNGAYCMTDPGANVIHSGAGVTNLSTTVLGRLTCPVIDTSATPKGGIASLSVLAVDNSTTAGVQANACVQFAGTPGGSCGATVTSSAAGTGIVNLSPPRTFWSGGTSANDFPYILVSLPVRASTVASASFLLGYSFSS